MQHASSQGIKKYETPVDKGPTATKKRRNQPKSKPPEIITIVELSSLPFPFYSHSPCYPPPILGFPRPWSWTWGLFVYVLQIVGRPGRIYFLVEHNYSNVRKPVIKGKEGGTHVGGLGLHSTLTKFLNQLNWSYARWRSCEGNLLPTSCKS